MPKPRWRTRDDGARQSPNSIECVNARFAGGSAVVEHQVRSRRVQAAADRRADALATSGDQHDPALHAALPESGLDLISI